MVGMKKFRFFFSIQVYTVQVNIYKEETPVNIQTILNGSQVTYYHKLN